jgi:hypothetical protein
MTDAGDAGARKRPPIPGALVPGPFEPGGKEGVN